MNGGIGMKESSIKNIWMIIRIGVSIALLALLTRLFDLSSVPTLFRGISPHYIALAFVLILLSVVVSAWKWSVLVQGQNIIVGYGELFAAYLAGIFFNNFFPSSIGGDATRVVCVGKKRGLIAEMTASVVAERLIAMTSLSVVGLAGALFSRYKNAAAIIVLVSVFVFSLILNLIIISGWMPAPVKNRTGKISRALHNASSSISLLRHRRDLVFLSFVGSAVFQTVVAAVMQSVLYAFALTSVPFVDMLFITSASSVLAMIPAGINGYGLREGSYVLLLAPYGISADGAVSASLLFAFLVAAFSITGLFSWLKLSQTKIFQQRRKSYVQES